MNPPAGWHPDPQNPTRLRYWNGQSWTDHYAQLDAPREAHQAPRTPVAPVAPVSIDPVTPEVESETGSNRKAIIVAASLIGIITVIGLAMTVIDNATDDGEATAAEVTIEPTAPTTPAPTETHTQKPDKNKAPKVWRPPHGFARYNADIAYKFLPSPQVRCEAYTTCWNVIVIPRTGCPNSLMVDMALTRGRVAVGQAIDTVGAVRPKQRALLKPIALIQDTNGVRGRISNITCF